MIQPPEDVCYYASSIVVKADEKPDLALPPGFALDIEVTGRWFSTRLLSEVMIGKIRAAAQAPLNSNGVTFDCILLTAGTPMKFLVDNRTWIQNEWDMP
jgi:hypothetical protein